MGVGDRVQITQREDEDDPSVGTAGTVVTAEKASEWVAVDFPGLPDWPMRITYLSHSVDDLIDLYYNGRNI